MALGKMAAVFALRTSVTSCKGIVFWIKRNNVSISETATKQARTIYMVTLSSDHL